MGAAAWLQLATEMIRANGQETPIVLTKSGDSSNSYEPSNLGRADGGGTEYQFYGAPLDFNVRDIDKVNIMTGQKMLWIPGTTTDGTAIIPEVGDIVTMNNGIVSFRVLEVTSYETESVNCAFLLKMGA